MRRTTYLGKIPRSWVTSFCNQGLSRGRDSWSLHARLVNIDFVTRGETFSGSTKRESALKLNPILVVFDYRTRLSLLGSLSLLIAVVAKIFMV